MIHSLDPRTWALAAIQQVKDSSHVIVRDPLGLLPPSDGDVHRFAIDQGFTVIEATTNLAFRELYGQAHGSGERHKLLVIDRAPPRRGGAAAGAQSPALFYPDLLEQKRPLLRHVPRVLEQGGTEPS